jgi:hypothetical protein
LMLPSVSTFKSSSPGPRAQALSLSRKKQQKARALEPRAPDSIHHYCQCVKESEGEKERKREREREKEKEIEREWKRERVSERTRAVVTSRALSRRPGLTVEGKLAEGKVIT